MECPESNGARPPEKIRLATVDFLCTAKSLWRTPPSPPRKTFMPKVTKLRLPKFLLNLAPSGLKQNEIKASKAQSESKSCLESLNHLLRLV